MSGGPFQTPALSTRSSMDDISVQPSGTQTPKSRAVSTRLGRHKSSYLMDSLPPPSPSWTPAPSIGPMSGTTTARTSRRNSFTSMHSTTSHGGIMEEIKHEAMVNFLFQQQCSKCFGTSHASASLTANLRKALDLQQRGWHRGCSRQEIARQLRCLPTFTG
jgi:hypothetical protein